ncbi:delta 9-fatty acid desaturase protein [Coniophora puteana RWD-64-598 SS2]|uniref:Acyl-CoA desaturase n=1 Tax=Coniophora puteana (strain RWD-64-598) TaxID=741705 RepID=A0A5M3M9W4_CONPW|nr:delta 9-fatty acid desaturase protein [Coniophora puteana RWD-64-598 SS2]EIW75726.1 delta 9-fatty acid desaturase protein [Coniophora puteana RWD-64-598 SS2]
MLDSPALRSLTAGFPKTKGVKWFNLGVLVITPALSIYGLLTVPILTTTVVATALYYVFSMIGITAGYHRLWSHRAYNASFPLQVFLMLAGASATQGSCYWWARRHRSHHRHTDTDLDPYNSERGLLWTHIGWIIFDTDLKPGYADITDLQRDPLVQWQHRWYYYVTMVWGYLVPMLLPGLLWNDWKGGFFFVGALRMTLCHHSTFCINSIAHYLGDTPYDDRNTPRDHLISAVLTMGEGYHNFHHQFPMDYRNAFRWYQYDPTKWFIALCYMAGLASHLRIFPSNVIEKGALTMKLKALKDVQDSLPWPPPASQLPVVTWEEFQEQSKTRALLLIAGFIHDASLFAESHPGGEALITQSAGKDVTASFFGGVYNHSHAAHNFLAMMRVGILAGGVENVGEHSIPPSQRLYIGTNMPEEIQPGEQ